MGCAGGSAFTLRSASRGRIPGMKITIPSDLRFHPQALSVNVGNPCGFPSPRSKGPQRAKPFRASAITLKFRVPSPLLAKLQRARELENFNFNLSGSDPVVANRAGVIVPQQSFLSTKKWGIVSLTHPSIFEGEKCALLTKKETVRGGVYRFGFTCSCSWVGFTGSYCFIIS